MRFKDNIWAADLDELGFLSSKNKIIKYLLCVIGVVSKHAWVKPLETKKAKQLLMFLSKLLMNLVNQIHF